MPEAAHSNQFTSTSSANAADNGTAGGNATSGTTSAEQPAPYGGPATAPAAPLRRIRTLDLIKAKAEGRRWAMLTSYDQYTAALFEQAGVEALLIGDSAANNVYGHATTLPVTVDELIPLARAVASATSRALIVADLPFGSYEISDEQAVAAAVRFVEASPRVKLEGGARMASGSRRSRRRASRHGASASPQAEHNLGGYKSGPRRSRERCSTTPVRWPSPEPSPGLGRWCLPDWPARSPPS